MTVATESAIHVAIKRRFEDEIEVPEGLVVRHENSSQFVAPQGNLWAALTILTGESFAASAGLSPLVRSVGTAVVQLFSPVGIGPGRAMEMAERIRDAFMFVTDSGVRFGAPTIRKVPTDSGAAFYQVNVSIPWRADKAL